MAKKTFYSFHYLPDAWRTSQVRNIGAIDGNRPATDNEWESVKKGGDKAVQGWIDEQLKGRSCTVVLIGKDTANRKWINYEIAKSWNDGQGVLGIDGPPAFPVSLNQTSASSERSARPST